MKKWLFPLIHFSSVLFISHTVYAEVSQKTEKTFYIHQDALYIRNKLESVIKQLCEQLEIPGLSIVLVKNDKVLWSEGFGYADKLQRIKATSDTVYRAGSLAKPFTAMAVMQLSERKMIDIDQPLDQYLHAFSIRSRFDLANHPITPRHIMYHHSGLPTDLNKGMWSNDDFRQIASKLSQEYAAFPPNHIFSYSNVGYSLLGHMIENVSQIPFEQYMQQNLFMPLNMVNTSMQMNSNIKASLAKGYSHGQEKQLLPIRDKPAYALYTSVSDLGHFMMALLTNDKTANSSILTPESLQEMLQAQNNAVALDLNVINGLGWFIERDTIKLGRKVIRHGGQTLLFSSELIFLPEEGLGVAVLANSKQSKEMVTKLAEEILKLASMTDEHKSTYSMSVKKNIMPSLGGSSSNIIGCYSTDFGFIEIVSHGKQLNVRIANIEYALTQHADGWFSLLNEADLPINYKTMKDFRYQSQWIAGKEVLLMQGDWGQSVVGEKVQQNPLSQAWKDRVGIYEIQNPDRQFPITHTELLVENNLLYMKYKMSELSESIIQIALRPISDKEAIIVGLGRTRGETVHVEMSGGVERVYYSGFYGIKQPPFKVQ